MTSIKSLGSNHRSKEEDRNAGTKQGAKNETDENKTESITQRTPRIITSYLEKKRNGP